MISKVYKAREMADGDVLLCRGLVQVCWNVAKTLQDWKDRR